MSHHRLSPIGGEFTDTDREASFRAERMPETLRHIRLLFILSAILNTLFFISDWRFYGTPHFYVAIPARATVVIISLICFFTSGHIRTFAQAEARMLAWQWVTSVGVGVLVSSHSDLALFVVVMLPSIFYLVVPTSFRWSLAGGLGCSIMMLIGYMHNDPSQTTALGLILAMLVLNIALILVVSRSNRLRRLEWSATLAERRAKEELNESRSMFEKLFKTVPIPLVVVKTDGVITNANDAAERFFGTSRHTLGIQSVEEIYAEPADRKNFLEKLERDGRIDNFETTVRVADGTIRNVLIAGTMVEIGGFTSVISGIVDITERKATEERIWRAASHDPLTDLPNRALFQSRFEQALAEAKRENTSVILFLIDLDDFKTINDTLGHDAGDCFLQEIAVRLRRMTRDVDTVARLGGDEFVVIVGAPIRLERAQALADRILEEIRRPYNYKGEMVRSRASIGIAVYPDHDAKPADLMKDADLALYSAKARGRNCAVLFQQDMRNLLERRMTMTRELLEAVRQRQIVPYYQPKVNIETGKVIGFEALARWNHPEDGLLTPAAFLAAFEDPEMSIALGEHMIREVCADIKIWLDAGMDCGRIAVNLSTAQFSWIGLARRFLDIVQSSGIAPERLDVEITETVFLGKSSAHVATALQQFHESGVRIALDDFGTGYASLIHLKQFPVDDIKIDQSFIRDVEHNSESAAIVTAVIQLGRSLNMAVVAEGVETRGQMQFLKDHGCTLVQGNLYGKPMMADDVPGFLKQSERTLVLSA